MLAWIEAHPVLAGLLFTIFWPLVTGIVTGLFKPRSAEEYAKIAAVSPRLAGFLRLVGAIGFDFPKMLEAVGQVIRGKIKTPPGAGLFIVVCFAISQVACGASQEMVRHAAREHTLLAADAGVKFQALCAEKARASQDLKLAEACQKAYDTSRAGLLSAEGFLDSWDAQARGSFICTMAHALDALAHGVEAYVAAGGKSPPLIDDALAMGSSLAKACTKGGT